ncbi:RICIN domain-containing protein [Rugamonas rivuli]|uniref:Glycoside hydrolase family 12 n=1 Tax=Rugamonas rivuli TaxID=2743358 RepID=A0A843S6P3_9BURK|nr:RICIN domain-containing protein [Rugamonas rivuli]MQA20045.1 glycoside hydrolase family 12 [Rugamonas rivuli]
MTTTTAPKLALAAAILLAYSAPSLAASTCDRYASYPVKGGTYTVITNFWNDKASGSQCVNVNQDNGEWSVSNAPSSPDSTPAAYPAIYKGCHWASCTKDSGLPLQAKAITYAPSRWRVTPGAGGDWDIAYDIWFSSGPVAPPSGQPDGAEIMIWINHSGSVQPAGTKTANVNINGMNWDVWTAWNNPSGWPRWNIVSYVATSPVNAVNFDLVPFFRDSVGRKAVDNNWYLLDVEAGTELWRNGAGFVSGDFDVQFHTDPVVGIDPNKWYSVVNKNSGSCVDDADFSTSNGAVVHQWACDSRGAANQQWKFTPTDSGNYRVSTQQAPGLAWDVAGWGTANGSLVQLWTYGGGSNQQWQAVDLGDGYYKFVGRGSGKCLDVPAASTSNGVQLQIYDCNGTPAQSFKLIAQ